MPTVPAYTLERIKCFYLINTNFRRPKTRSYDVIPPSSSSYSSFSIGSTVRCGFWPIENFHPFLPICHQLSPSFHSQHLKISFCFFFPANRGYVFKHNHITCNDHTDTRNKDLTKKLVLHINSLSGRL